MAPFTVNIAIDEERLADLAMQFRGTSAKGDRDEIAKEYSETVDRLIQTGVWNEMPPPEDQLPSDWMPRSFYRHWIVR